MNLPTIDEITERLERDRRAGGARIRESYNWERVTGEYERLFLRSAGGEAVTGRV